MRPKQQFRAADDRNRGETGSYDTPKNGRNIRIRNDDRDKRPGFSVVTIEERRDHNVIDGKRRKRIAAGSGTSVQEVNQVLKQYSDMRRMMKQYGSFAKTKMRGLGKFAGMKPPPGLAGEK